MTGTAARKGPGATARPQLPPSPKYWVARQLGRRPPPPGSWTIHATVDEPTELLCAFVAHHLALGASEVALYLDKPRPGQLEILSAIPGTRIVVPTAGYWRLRRLRRPRNHVVRQSINATDAYHQCKTEWFFFVDADEFLSADAPVAQVLSQIDPSAQLLRLPVAERVFGPQTRRDSIFAGPFRTPLAGRPKLMERLYGPQRKFLNAGMTGHPVGKSATRTGLFAQVWIHFPKQLFPRSNHQEAFAAHQAAPTPPGIGLRHFDGLTRLHWQLKLLNKIVWDPAEAKKALDNNTTGRGASRHAQIEAVYHAAMNGGGIDDLLGLQTMSKAQIRLLREKGGLLPPLKGIEETTRALFPEAQLDFTPATFDARLRDQYKDLINAFDHFGPGA